MLHRKQKNLYFTSQSKNESAIKKVVRMIRDSLIKLKIVICNRTIQKELMVALILMALLPATTINLFYFSKMNLYMENKIKSYNSEIIRQVGDKLDSLLDQVDIIIKQLIATAVTLEAPEDQADMPAHKKIELIKQTEDTLKNIRRSFPTIFDIYLLELDGEIYSTNPNYNKDKLLKQSWLDSIQGDLERGGKVITPTRRADYINVNDETAYAPVISFFKKVKEYGGNQDTKIIQVDINYEIINKTAHNVSLGEEGFILVVDNNDRVIYSPDKNYLGCQLNTVNYMGFNYENTNGFMGTDDKDKALLLTHSLNNADWRIIGIIPTGNIYQELMEVKSVSTIITVISIVFSFILSYVLSKRITKPITKIIGKMRKVGEGEFNVVIPNMKNKDLQVLTRSFNIMVGEINILMNNIVEKENEKMNAELKALQTQINSHFLYNTLNSIKWMALMENSHNIAHAIVALVQILEFSYKNHKKIIYIKDEIDFIKNYILIQKMRYGDCFQVIYDIEEELYQYGILKFTLQPIIENSIIHGFSGRSHDGLVVVRGRLLEDRMVFQIEDNGVGMLINEKEKFSGLGIENVDTRIKLNFGPSYGLRLDSSPGKGTCVTIDLPRVLVEEV